MLFYNKYFMTHYVNLCNKKSNFEEKNTLVHEVAGRAYLKSTPIFLIFSYTALLLNVFIILFYWFYNSIGSP